MDYKLKYIKYKSKYNLLCNSILGGATSDIKIKYFIQSLNLPEREKNVKDIKSILPEAEIFQSINGYNINETKNELTKSRLKYKNLEFKTYGTLANYLTKFKAFKYQIENNIEYMCLLEDDVIITDRNFDKFLKSKLYLLKTNNILRLSNWGEGYLTNVEGAKNIIDSINKNGIISNIDNQLRNNCGNEVFINAPIKTSVSTNKGDCLKTKTFYKP
tara:strand:+ start:1384 stop:2031 length:648 start_codon:yes stop_codon:yes gene_type:complete